MKTIGLIGGMSWESTAVYYQHLNTLARDRLGGLHSARLLLWSFDFADVEARQAAGDWEGLTDLMVDAARRLERGGAACLVICTNTMHRMAPEVEAAVDVPLVHIADATAVRLKARGVQRPALLATRYTMEQDFYTGRLRGTHGLDVRVPDAPGRTRVHDIIYQELCRGVVRPESRETCVGIVEHLGREGADGVILGCTEVGLLLDQSHVSVPLFDTTRIHAEAAMDFALG